MGAVTTVFRSGFYCVEAFCRDPHTGDYWILDGNPRGNYSVWRYRLNSGMKNVTYFATVRGVLPLCTGSVGVLDSTGSLLGPAPSPGRRRRASVIGSWPSTMVRAVAQSSVVSSPKGVTSGTPTSGSLHGRAIVDPPAARDCAASRG
jgi:hypothetical protein